MKVNYFKKIIIIFLFGSFLSLGAEGLITPIPDSIKYDKEKALLGKKLFFDPRLSADGTVSCETCHNLYLNYSGVDGLPISVGINERVGSFNAPTVLNAVFNFRQFWNGRAKNLYEQAADSIENPVEMDSSAEIVEKRVKGDAYYKEQFAILYSDGITYKNIIHAIVEFEKALITPNSRFDKYLKGDKEALNDREKKGYNYFQTLGCVSCHNGVNMGGNLYSKFGVFESIADLANFGRFEVTKNERDKFYFKVPSLRNISMTSPYLHDGNMENLREVISVMSFYQIGKDLEEEENYIYEFLLTLDGEKPEILNEN